jgi:chemosensory pili system protein ChpA (sensor histidine kinase/response regulator)
LEEADELYPQLSTELNAWRASTDDLDEGLKIARKIQRNLHTLKGSARMAGAMRLGELTHRVEDCLDSAVAAGKHDAELLDELEGYFDRIGIALEKLRTGDVAEEATEPVVLAIPAKNITQPEQVEQLTEVAEERRESAILRIRSDIVDDLVNEAGEISVARSRMEIELSAFKGGLQDLTGSVQGLRKLVREIEMHAEGQMQARAAVAGESAEKFDPLEFDRFTRFQELTRFMSESVHDVQTVQQTLLKNLDETSAAMSAQAKLNTVLQQSLMSIRMLPFSSASQRLYRIVRQTGKELGKKVNLELYGAEIELDRGVLEKMTAPFEHLLRNAIVHGLENPEQRELKGKSPIGNIALTLRQEGNEVVFEFKDDGAGLDTVKLRQKGVEQGLLQADELVSDEKVMLLIFETGLSTASELTEISGRGVGMDVVLSEIKALGGRIEVSSEINKGACFTIYLPLTLAVMKALMVRAGNETYAIPSVMVEQVQQVKPANLNELYQKGQAEWQNKSYPFHYLPRLLGDKERTPDSKPYNAILLLRSGEQRMALHLDELIGNKEIVVKNVGVQLARLPGVAGATVQANGKVVLIINPVPLAQQASHTQKPGEKGAVESSRRTPLVMIVDDSLTVRKITSRLLTRVGYDVVTAKDGVDALEKLVDIMPDVMLLDVEMPRMDGFELTKQLRRDSKTKSLPIIMITSRTADKHRNYAMELGVNEYLGKPYQDEELLENIARFAPLPETVPAL